MVWVWVCPWLGWLLCKLMIKLVGECGLSSQGLSGRGCTSSHMGVSVEFRTTQVKDWGCWFPGGSSLNLHSLYTAFLSVPICCFRASKGESLSKRNVTVLCNKIVAWYPIIFAILWKQVEQARKTSKEHKYHKWGSSGLPWTVWHRGLSILRPVLLHSHFQDQHLNLSTIPNSTDVL